MKIDKDDGKVPAYIHKAIKDGEKVREQTLAERQASIAAQQKAKQKAETAARNKAVTAARKWFKTELPNEIKNATALGERTLSIGNDEFGKIRAEVCKKNGMDTRSEYHPPTPHSDYGSFASWEEYFVLW